MTCVLYPVSILCIAIYIWEVWWLKRKEWRVICILYSMFYILYSVFGVLQSIFERFGDSREHLPGRVTVIWRIGSGVGSSCQRRQGPEYVDLILPIHHVSLFHPFWDQVLNMFQCGLLWWVLIGLIGPSVRSSCQRQHWRRDHFNSGPSVIVLFKTSL